MAEKNRKHSHKWKRNQKLFLLKCFFFRIVFFAVFGAGVPSPRVVTLPGKKTASFPVFPGSEYPSSLVRATPKIIIGSQNVEHARASEHAIYNFVVHRTPGLGGLQCPHLPCTDVFFSAHPLLSAAAFLSAFPCDPPCAICVTFDFDRKLHGLNKFAGPSCQSCFPRAHRRRSEASVWP